MDVIDVGHVTQLNGVGMNYVVQERLILQHFDNNGPVLDVVSPHNCGVRISDSADWPPDLLFDAAYRGEIPNL
jgi:hypothetical protein